MGSYSIYKVTRPSDESGTRLKVYVEWTSDRDEAVRRADEVYTEAGRDVEAVEVVDYGSKSWAEISYRVEEEDGVAS